MKKILFALIVTLASVILPSSLYAQNYVRTNGTACFDTGVKPSPSVWIKLNVRIKDTKNTYIFGAASTEKNSDGKPKYIYGLSRTGNRQFSFSFSTQWYNTYYVANSDINYFIRMKCSDLSPTYRGDLEITQNNTHYECFYGELSNRQEFMNSTDVYQTIYLGGAHNIEGSNTDMEIYDCTIYLLNSYGTYEPHKHFVPAKQGNTFGMIETISGEFSPMSGTGATGYINEENCNHESLELLTSGDQKGNYRCKICGKTTIHHSPFISTNGTSWFDTGVIPTKATSIQLDMCALQDPDVLSPRYGETWCDIFGEKDGDNAYFSFSHSLGHDYDDRDCIEYRFGGGKKTVENPNRRSLPPLGRYSIVADCSRAEVKDILTRQTISTCQLPNTYTSTNPTKSIYIGTINGMEEKDNESNIHKPYNMAIYEVKIYESGQMIHDFIPVKTNNVVGMRDLSTGEFKPMSGSGADIFFDFCDHENVRHETTLTANGTEQSVFCCQKCGAALNDGKNYVSNNGTAYFDTQFAPTQNTMMKMNCFIDNITADKNQYIMSTSSAATGNDVKDYLRFEPQNHLFHYHNDNNFDRNSLNKISIALSEYDFLLNLNKWSINRYDREEKQVESFTSEWTASKLNTPRGSIKLGYYPNNTSTDMAANVSFYGCDIIENGEVVRHFLPAHFRGKWGMFDTQARSFYPMSGNGACGYIDTGHCEHTYTTYDRSDGKIGEHCYICDSYVNPTYYYNVKFDKNADDAYGTMGDQEIITKGKLVSLAYKRNNYLFDGWNDKPDGTGQSYADGAEMVATAGNCGTLKLYAQWLPGFTVNGETKIINQENIQDISIVDDAKNGFGAAKSFTAKKISYERAFTEEWGTLCLPFGISNNDKVTLYQPTAVEGDKMLLTQVDNAAAGVPVIFHKNTADATIKFEASNVDIVTQPQADATSGTISLMGSFVYNPNLKCQEGTEYYVISNDIFYHVTSNIILSPFRAYFTHSSAVSAKEMLYPVEDVTGISELTNSGQQSGAIYNLQGIRVDHRYKGMIIKNGKKYIAK